jgi:hypothetical protein
VARLTYSSLTRALINRLAEGKAAGLFRTVGFYRGDLEDLLDELTVEAPVPPSAWITLDREDVSPETVTSTDSAIHYAVLVFAENQRSAYEGAVGQSADRQGALELLQAARDYLHNWQPPSDDAQEVEWTGAQLVYTSRKRNLVVMLGRFVVHCQLDDEGAAMAIEQTKLAAKVGGRKTYESTEED